MDRDFYSPVEAHEGGSGYFSAPANTLDPNLFHDHHLDPLVRQRLLSTLYDFWTPRFASARTWSTVWLAGSGISYQWAADRSNGDLDVLVGVDFSQFWFYNPHYAGIGEDAMADLFNRGLREELWPKTAHTKIGKGIYEVTFYVNPGAQDIRDIKPYAAYDLTSDEWTVRPPNLPPTPESLYPNEWSAAVARERDLASSLIERYNKAGRALKAAAPGSPGWHNTAHELTLVADQARALYDDIHLGRKKAFGPQGAGYGDYYNYRWQSHKRYGTAQALHAITSAEKQSEDEAATSQYGAPIQSADEALVTATLWNRR